MGEGSKAKGGRRRARNMRPLAGGQRVAGRQRTAGRRGRWGQQEVQACWATKNAVGLLQLRQCHAAHAVAPQLPACLPAPASQPPGRSSQQPAASSALCLLPDLLGREQDAVHQGGLTHRGMLRRLQGGGRRCGCWGQQERACWGQCWWSGVSGAVCGLCCVCWGVWGVQTTACSDPAPPCEELQHSFG